MFDLAMEQSSQPVSDDIIIAMIDDDEIGLFIFHTIAKRIPFLKAELYQSALDVIDLMRADRFRPHVILLDINMPIMDGWEFLDEFEKWNIPIPVYIVSSSGNSMDLQKSKQYNSVKGFYCKPISGTDIQAIVDTIPVQH